ncbi:hypothetical protein EVAR_13429_1 [Eumeta japonica]|uniref:Uncharacterized protein n=1 Tax=Eumeta variegata TaxID=151549 RepID=A0A4C1V6Y9_EUMVA|nr:hypothetical protein EVAR_13429_1 [Eumeta japonica]
MTYEITFSHRFDETLKRSWIKKRSAGEHINLLSFRERCFFVDSYRSLISLTATAVVRRCLVSGRHLVLEDSKQNSTFVTLDVSVLKKKKTNANYETSTLLNRSSVCSMIFVTIMFMLSKLLPIDRCVRLPTDSPGRLDGSVSFARHVSAPRP